MIETTRVRKCDRCDTVMEEIKDDPPGATLTDEFRPAWAFMRAPPPKGPVAVGPMSDVESLVLADVCDSCDSRMEKLFDMARLAKPEESGE